MEFTKVYDLKRKVLDLGDKDVRKKQRKDFEEFLQLPKDTNKTHEFTKKCSLDKFCTNDKLKEEIRNRVTQIHRLRVETCHLINLHLRLRYKQASSKKEFPIETSWDKDLVKKYIQAVGVSKNGKPAIPLDVIDVRDNHYIPLRREANLPDLENRTGLSDSSLEELATSIATTINTNIIEHFFKRQYSYLFHQDIEGEKQEEIEKDSKERRKLRKARHKRTREKQEAINSKTGTTNEPSLPNYIEKSVVEDLESNPEKFLYPMWIMNSFLESRGKKKFALLPLTKRFVPSASLSIDTKTLGEMANRIKDKDIFTKFKEYKKQKEDRLNVDRKEQKAKQERDRMEFEEKIKEGKEEVDLTKKPKQYKQQGRDTRKHVLEEKNLLWHIFFDPERLFTKSQIERGKANFAHRIVTDGVSVSVNHFRPEVKKKPKGRTAKRFRKKEKFGVESLDMLSNMDFKDIDLNKIVGVDPGKHTILHMTNASSPVDHPKSSKKKLTRKEQLARKKQRNDKILKYTAGQRQYESKSVRRNKTLQDEKPDDVQQLEDVLSQTDSKSNSVAEFKRYLSARFQVQEQLYSYYGKERFRIFRWRIWRDRRSSEDKFINKIGETFGDDVVLAYGTWNQYFGKGLSSSPTTSLKRRIAKKYTVIDTQEHNTTKSCSRCHHEMKGDPTRTKPRAKSDGTIIKERLRSIRLCTNKETCGGFLRWDRDHNAAINIRARLIRRLQVGEWETLPCIKKAKQRTAPTR